jgi:hypothetical protein
MHGYGGWTPVEKLETHSLLASLLLFFSFPLPGVIRFACVVQVGARECVCVL